MNREDFAYNFFELIEKNTDCKVAVYSELNPDGISIYTKRINLAISFMGVNFKTKDYDLQALNGGLWNEEIKDLSQSTLNMASILTLYDVSRWAVQNNIKDDIATLDFRKGEPNVIVVPASDFKRIIKKMKEKYLS